jgi:hypothetical protein
VIQKHEEEQASYKRLVAGLRRRSEEQKRQAEKGALSLIYERLMGML